MPTNKDFKLLLIIAKELHEQLAWLNTQVDEASNNVILTRSSDVINYCERISK